MGQTTNRRPHVRPKTLACVLGRLTIFSATAIFCACGSSDTSSPYFGTGDGGSSGSSGDTGSSGSSGGNGSSGSSSGSGSSGPRRCDGVGGKTDTAFEDARDAACRCARRPRAREARRAAPIGVTRPRGPSVLWARGPRPSNRRAGDCQAGSHSSLSRRTCAAPADENASSHCEDADHGSRAITPASAFSAYLCGVGAPFPVASKAIGERE